MRFTLLLFFLVTIIAVTGCARAAVDPETEPPVEIDAQAAEEKIDKGDWSHEYISWPEEIPEAFPPYADGDIIDFDFNPGSYPNIVFIENTSVQAIESYVAEAQGTGYSLEWEREKMGDEDLSWAVELKKGDTHYGIILAYFEDFSGSSGYLSLTLSRF